MISRDNAKSKLKNLTEHTNNKLAILVSARSVIDNIFDSVGSCETCEYSEKAINTRWKCEWIDGVRVNPKFFCADYVRSKKR